MNSRTSPFPNKWQWYVASDDLSLYGFDGTAGNYMTVHKGSATAAEFGLNGSHTANTTLTVTSVAATSRPYIYIVNANQDTVTASNGRAFFGWLPISINIGATQTTKWIPLYD
jgi:hypothetical protein